MHQYAPSHAPSRALGDVGGLRDRELVPARQRNHARASPPVLDVVPAQAAEEVWLWLDDDLERRPTPPGWRRVFSANEAIRVLASETVAFLSLDYDMGDYAHDGGDAASVTDWMAGNDRWPLLGVNVHSGNPIGAKVMLATIDRYSPYPLGYTRARGLTPSGGWPRVLR